MKCPTSSGRYHCTVGDAGHPGACETDDAPAPKRVGPYRDAHRARAYLRGRLDSAAGAELDGVGRLLELPRGKGEPDQIYRARLWSSTS